jgi:hypothetical protein
MGAMSARPLLPVLCLAAAVVALTHAGCGGNDSEEGDGRADTPTATTLPDSGGEPELPEMPRNEDPSRVECTGPPRGVFDATAVVGEPLAAAEAEAGIEGCSVREVIRDGEGLAVTEDYRPDRVNVATRDGDVTRIVSIG